MPKSPDFIGNSEKRKGLCSNKLPKRVRKKRACHVTAKAVVLAEDRLLLLRNSNGKWDLPGGRLDRGETVLTGLHREVIEETGVEIESLTLLTTSLRRKKSSRDIFVTTFLCRPKRDNLRARHITISDEHEDFTFVKPKKARKLKWAQAEYREAVDAAERMLRQA